MQHQPQGYFQPQVQTSYQGPVGGVSGYSTGGTPQMNINAGAQYQQQREWPHRRGVALFLWTASLPLAVAWKCSRCARRATTT